jgi:hypothetical protein
MQLPALPHLGVFGGSFIPVPPIFDLTPLLSTLPDDIAQQVIHHDPEKPILPSSDKAFAYPVSIDGGGYVIGGYKTTIQTVTEKTGTPADISLNFPATNLQHLALYANLRGTANQIESSDTYIIYEKDQPLQIVDPHGYFNNIKFDLTVDGITNKVDYKISFAKPMETSDIIFRAWNDRSSSSDMRLNSALQVIEGTVMPSGSLQSGMLATPAQNQTLQAPQTYQQVQGTAPDLVSAIKDWGGYSAHPISDSELLSKIGLKGQAIPKWVLGTTKYVASDDLTPDEFENIAKYLASKGIIK